MNVLGRYQILEQLGTGSMGTVYRARDARLDRDVALKTIRTSGEVEPEIRERFYREARACARLQHENIVHVYDVGEEEAVAFIAMELLHGEDLRKTIERRREIPLASKLAFMIQVCEAMQHAHSRGVIHRDIKPSNLFLTDDGRAKVMDFGIARLPSSRLTVAGNILGTPNYMAPEQMLGKPTDARSDLFSAALVFFEFLCYVHPFHASVIPKRIVEGEPDSLFDHNPNLPVLLEKILDRALSKQPDARYGSGDEMASDLRAVLDAVKLNASPTMSRVELPSERALPRDSSVTDGDLTLLKPAPEGEDPAEWRLSEVLRLIPEFEDAHDRKDKAAAHKALDELRAIATADKRFLEAAESCQAAYEKTWGAEPEPVGGGAAAMPAPEPVVEPPKPVAPPPAVKAQPAVKQQPVARPAAASADRKKVAYTAAAVLAGIIVLGWVISLFTKPVPLQDAVATARVQGARAEVRKAAEDSAAAVVAVPGGEPIRVLTLPADRMQQWILVQAVVEGKNYTPGYVKASELNDWTEWSFANAAAPEQLARVMAPKPDASDAELTAYAGRLRSFADRVAAVGADQGVLSEAARLEDLVAKRNPPAPVGESGVPEAVPPPAVPAETPAVEETAASLIRRAERAKQNVQLDRAMSLVNQALEKEPNNAAAVKLRDEIKGLMDALR